MPGWGCDTKAYEKSHLVKFKKVNLSTQICLQLEHTFIRHLHKQLILFLQDSCFLVNTFKKNEPQRPRRKKKGLTSYIFYSPE